MRESGYYPPGAEFDPNAPWNEIPIPEKDFVVTISQTVSKTVNVLTDDYARCYDDETGYEYADTQDTDWKEAYAKDHEDIPKLLSLLKSYIERDLECGDSKYSKEQLKYFLKECEDWIVDETEVVE